jgi:hypothetical protein
MNVRLAFTVGVMLLALGTAVAAAGTALDPLTVERTLQTSQTPELLGPISVEGRTGWACEPEKAAGAVSVRSAHLPIPEPAN